MNAQVTMTGNLGTEVSYSVDSGIARAHFRMAHTRRRRRGEEWVDDQTMWVRVNCSYQLATNARASLGKGDAVVVAGRLRVFGWVSDDGISHEMLIIDAETIGHDLTKGTTQFTRSAQAAATPAADLPGKVTAAPEASALAA